MAFRQHQRATPDVLRLSQVIGIGRRGRSYLEYFVSPTFMRDRVRTSGTDLVPGPTLDRERWPRVRWHRLASSERGPLQCSQPTDLRDRGRIHRCPAQVAACVRWREGSCLVRSLGTSSGAPKIRSLLVGAGRFVDDLPIEGTPLRGVRAQLLFPHAVIRGVDTSGGRGYAWSRRGLCRATVGASASTTLLPPFGVQCAPCGRTAPRFARDRARLRLQSPWRSSSRTSAEAAIDATELRRGRLGAARRGDRHGGRVGAGGAAAVRGHRDRTSSSRTEGRAAAATPWRAPTS